MSVVHPAFEAMVRRSRESPEPHPARLTVEERRAAFREQSMALRGEMADMARDDDLTLDLSGRTLRARLYVPDHDDARAIVVYFHGGSFVVGDLDTHDWLCRRLAADTGLRFLAVEYRLAPEHPFPAPLEDVTDALRHVAAHRKDFADEDALLIVMGESAGANLATVAARLVRDERFDLAAQVLIYPTLGPELLTDSAHRFATGYLLELDHLRYDYEQYLGEYRDHTDPRVTPLFCDDLSGVAPAVVIVAECDPLRDEAVAYAGLLGHYNVPVNLLEAKGMVHGFLEMGGVVPEALAIVDDLARHLHQLVEVASA